MVNDPGPLAVTLLDSDRDVYHAVAIVRDPRGRRVILDHEAPDALLFTKGALESCVAAGRTVVGFDDVMLITTRGQAARDTRACTSAV